MPAGEGTKNFAHLQQVCDAVLAARIERGDLIVALGGGVVGDLAGFAASVVRRGIDFVQVPTTLLAQVNSSVGGKTGINTRHGKNLIGAFHQPILVIADTALLDTLPEREFRAGYAEVVKYGLLGEREFFEWLEQNWQDVFTGGPARGKLRRRANTPCSRACRPRPRSCAATSARPATACCSISATPSAMRSRPPPDFPTGCCTARRSGSAWRWRSSSPPGAACCRRPMRTARSAHLAAVGLPTHIEDVRGGHSTLDTLMELIAQDKKVKRGELTFILVRGIGQSFVARDVEAADVRAFLAREALDRRTRWIPRSPICCSRSSCSPPTRSTSPPSSRW